MEPTLFGKRDETKPQPGKKNVGAPPPGLQRLNEVVNETGSRLAVMEERMVNLRKKSQLIEQSSIEYERETRSDLKALGESLTELSRKVEEVKEKIDAMTGELSSVVKRHELAVVERYIEMWEPLQFVTREEAKLLIKDALERQGKKS